MKRLLTLLLLAAGFTTGAWAQTAQLTRDGYLVKTFTGASSLSSAISAAASKGDIIVLSSGSFSNPGNITKSVSIYGQGFENSTAIGGARTYISGKLEYKLMSEGALDGIHLEGLYIENDLNILTNIGTTAVIDDFTVKKCHSGGVFFYQCSTNVILQNCKFDRDVRTYPDSYTTTMQVDNCYIEGNLFKFADGSNIIVNNSLIHNNWYQNYSAATSFNNCIIYKDISNGSSATKCIFNQSSVSGSTDNCWMGVNNGDIYVSEGEDGSYGESKSFAVKDTYVGTDNTPVGLQGGIGWNKTPTIPSYLTPEDLPQDAEGYYLLDGKMAWLVFAALVNGGTYDAKAKMTADIDLGTSQTAICAETNIYYQGEFDGQGHTLTVHYDDSNDNFRGTFSMVENALIKNLHVTGTITTNNQYTGPIVGMVNKNSTIQNCRSSVECLYTGDQAAESGGIIGFVYPNITLTITDCLFDGSILTNTTSAAIAKYLGGLVGQNCYGTVSMNNCLFAPRYISTDNEHSSDATLIGDKYMKNPPTNNSYYSTRLGTAQGTQATAAQLSDGTTTTNLNASRTGDAAPWVQDPLTNQPMLKLFAGKYKVPASRLGTFSAKANFVLPEGLEAFCCKHYDSAEGTISVEPIEGVVPANTGVLLRGTAGETYTLTISNETAATVTDNALVAVTDQTTIQQINGDYTNFGLSGGEFKMVNSAGGTVKANRAYLQIPTNALSQSGAARGIAIDWDDEATAIDKEVIVKGVDSTSGQWYTIGGRKLAGQPTQRGIYIVNGKKVVIK